MTARNTAASGRLVKPHTRLVHAILGGIIAATGRHSRALQKRKPTRDERDLDQRVRECGEW